VYCVYVIACICRLAGVEMSFLLAACVVVCQLVALSTNLALCSQYWWTVHLLVHPAVRFSVHWWVHVSSPIKVRTNTCVLFMSVCVCVFLFGGVGAPASTVVYGHLSFPFCKAHKPLIIILENQKCPTPEWHVLVSRKEGGKYSNVRIT